MLRYTREARALAAARIEELDQLDDEALGELIERPQEEVTAGPSGEAYEVGATAYAGEGVPEREPDIYVGVWATRTGDRPPYMEIEGEIGRFRDPEAKRHNWTALFDEEPDQDFGIGDLVFWSVMAVPWVVGVFFLVTRFV